MKDINQLMVKENILWRQRAKSFWLVGGDKNSKYFHSRATLRHWRNRIIRVHNLEGEWVTHPNEIAHSFTEFYQTLITSSNPNVGGLELNQLERLVNDNMNTQLSQEFMEWEVQAALKQMAPLKSLGPDGMPSLFYQHYWDLGGGDVTNSILSFLNTATLPEPLNHTFLTLIPKIKNPISMSDYRPISLCNVLYKIFSKVLANRLKRILPSIITEHQNAFTIFFF